MLGWLRDGGRKEKERERDEGRMGGGGGGANGIGNGSLGKGVNGISSPPPSRIPVPTTVVVPQPVPVSLSPCKNQKHKNGVLDRTATTGSASALLPPGVSLHVIGEHNIHLVRQINSVVFPVRYNEKFYRDVVAVHAKELSCLGKVH